MTERPTTPTLLISESAQASMVVAANSAHPFETGGILVGVYHGDEPWATVAVEIASDERAHHRYKIPHGATQPAVRVARRADPRLGYLGDWHSHPIDSGPSATDLATLAIISLTHPRVPNPTLIVVRRTTVGYSLDARRVVFAGPRVCDVNLMGDLPPFDRFE